MVFSVAAPALVPDLVLASGLAAANARIELARTLAFTAGPALAGALIAWIAAPSAFALAAALSCVAVSLLVGLDEPQRPAVPPRHPLRDVKEGADFVFGHAMLLPVFVTQFIYSTAFFVVQAVFVPYAIQRLGLSASGVGATLAVYGIGMVVAALLASRMIQLLPFGAVVAVGPVTGLIAALVMVVTFWAPWIQLAAVGFFLLGFGTIIWVVSTTTLRQTVTPPNLLGRVSAINIMAYGARPLGAALGALVGEFYGTETALVVAALGFLIQALVILASPVVRLARQPELAA